MLLLDSGHYDKDVIMTRKKHENAFVVDWNQRKVAFWTTNVINAYFSTYGNGDKPQKRKENNGQRGGGTNTCYFLLNEKGGHIEHAKGYRYNTKTAYQAKVLNRLMRIVLEYQRYYQIQYNLRDEMGDDKKESWCYSQLPYQHAKKIVESARDWWIKAESDKKRFYTRDWDDTEEKRNEIGFGVSELDVSKKQDIKPCFFCKEYKIVDENGHPFYVVVMLEKGDEKDKDGNDLWFNYRVKFVGSGQPLTKFVAQVPLCYDAEKERYQQKSEEYRTANKDYYNRWRDEICERFVEDRETFIDKFKTQDVEVARHWIPCSHVRDTDWCDDYYYMKYRYCYENKCHFYRGWDVKKEKHDGPTAMKFFANAFGDAVTKLVSAGRFTYANKGLLPDISDVNFIKAFNHFCWYAFDRYRRRWGMGFSKDNKVEFWNYYINYFDHTDEFKKAEENIQGAIKTIEDWINNPNVFSYVYSGIQYTTEIDKKVVVPAKEDEEEPVEESEDLKTRMAHLKECLLNKRLHMVENPAILVESPKETTKIVNVWDDRWGDCDKEDNWWTTYSFVGAEYIKSDKPGKQSIVYKFKCDDETHRYPGTEDLAYSVQYAMEILWELQSKTKIKWAPGRLFDEVPKEDDSEQDKKQGQNKRNINVLRVNENYNGVTILDPNNIKEPITCDHYEVRKVDMDNYVSWQPTAILLYTGRNKVTGIIHCGNPEQIIPHIVSHSKIRQMLADRKAYTALKQYNTERKQIQKWVAQSAEDEFPF